MTNQTNLAETRMLDFHSRPIARLLEARKWRELPLQARIGAVYDFVRDEIAFGYNARDTLPASAVLADGYGQCNTKATLLMALLRGVGVPCVLHGFTIHKSLQRGVVPEAIYWMAPRNILHSWVEVEVEGRWVTLEGFILDRPVLNELQRAFPDRNSLCGYGAGTDCLQAPRVDWTGQDTFIQSTGINQDFGLYDSPDAFFADHQQELTGLRGLFFRTIARHWMNRRVGAMRRGAVPVIPGGSSALAPGFSGKFSDRSA